MKKRYFSALIVIILIVLVLFYNNLSHDDYITILNEPDLVELDLKYDPEKYLISPDLQCPEEELLGIIIVTSYVGHDSLRAIHRTAISQAELQKMGFKRVFLLGQIPLPEKFITQTAIESEHGRYGDIVQGRFLEHYHNLTAKHLMGLEWASTICPSKFILKLDDDSVFNIFSIHEMLKYSSVSKGSFYLSGYLFRKQKPQRLKPDKHFVSYEEFPYEFYPPFVSGWLYITNSFTAMHLIEQSREERRFWIDDTFITGILAKNLPINHIPLNDHFSPNPEFLDCCIRDMKAKGLACEFWVGPNGGDNKMLMEFTKSLRMCKKVGCKTRKGISQDTRKTCVAVVKNNLNDHGNPIIHSIKL